MMKPSVYWALVDFLEGYNIEADYEAVKVDILVHNVEITGTVHRRNYLPSCVEVEYLTQMQSKTMAWLTLDAYHDIAIHIPSITAIKVRTSK
jgi:hypothetical protein